MDDVLTELRLASDSLDRLYGTQLRRNDALQAQIDKLWQEVSDLRDATHESLTELSKRLESAMATPFGVSDADA